RALVKEPAERFSTAGEFLAALRRASPGRNLDAPRVAVLSFVHAGGPTAVGPFSERITEEVIYALTDLGGLEVSVHSTIPLGEAKLHVSKIARQLEADALLFATVRETNGVVQLAATLLHATSGSHLWSGTFTGRGRGGVVVVSDLAAQ